MNICLDLGPDHFLHLHIRTQYLGEVPTPKDKNPHYVKQKKITIEYGGPFIK